MRNSRAVLATIERLYGAVVEAREWPAALESAADLLRADHAIVLAPGSGASDPAVAAIRMDAQYVALYGTPDAARIAAPLLQRLPAGVAVSSAAVVPDREMARSAFYNEILRPANGFYSANVRLLAADRTTTMINFCRPRRAGAFGNAEVATLQALLPHLANAIELRRRLAAAQQQNQSLLRLLDRLDVGVILVDAAARPSFANGRAMRIMAEADGLMLGPSGLLAATPAATHRLHHAIAVMKAASAGGESVRLRLRRPSLRPPLLLSLCPIGSLGGGVATAPKPFLAIFIAEPDDGPPLDRAALAEAFQLTPREVAVVALLAEGHDLRATADALAISIGTARNYLKRVFEKTGTHGQVGLLALLRGFAGPT